MQIAIDAGHGYVKAISESGRRRVFPALIHPAPSAVDLGEFGRATTTTIDDADYLVGEPARRLASPLWTRNKAVDDDTLRLILVAAAELGASGPVHLGTGLPLAWYGEQRQAFKTTLRGFGGTVRTANGIQNRLWFESVLVLPQGIAAAGPVLADPKYEPGPYLIVDIGFRTTDYIIVTKQPGGDLDFDALAAGSLEMGMHVVQGALADHLTKTHHTVFTAAQVADTDAVFVRGMRIDIAFDRAQQETRVARSIVKGLMEKLDSQMEQVMGLVAVGGGSDILARAIPDVIQPTEPQWANASGYLMALMAKHSLSSRISG